MSTDSEGRRDNVTVTYDVTIYYVMNHISQFNHLHLVYVISSDHVVSKHGEGESSYIIGINAAALCA